MSATIRENLLTTMALYAGDMNRADIIDLPIGVAGEDELADFCVECVDAFIAHKNAKWEDLSFTEYAEECLKERFGWREDGDREDFDDYPTEVEDDYPNCNTEEPTHRIVAVSGTVEKELDRGSYEWCEGVCDMMDWVWQPDGPDGFTWSLEIDEL